MAGLMRGGLPLIPPDVHVDRDVAYGAQVPDDRPLLPPDPAETGRGICS